MFEHAHTDFFLDALMLIVEYIFIYFIFLTFPQFFAVFFNFNFLFLHYHHHLVA